MASYTNAVDTVLVKKTHARIWKSFFRLSNLSKSVVVLENLIHWDLKTAVYPIFAKLVFDIFAVSSLVPWINLSHTQQGYLRPKNQNYLLGVAELGFSLSYELGTTIKITIFSTFYVIDNFSSCYRQNFCKKYRLFQ